MKKIASKIKRAIEFIKLNLELLGERHWYNYYSKITALDWSRNFHNGYIIEVYSEKFGHHLAFISI